MLPDFHLDLPACLRVVPQKLLGVLPALSDLGIIVGIPCTALHHDAAVGCQIQDIAHCGDPLSKHDVKLRLPERRCDLVLYNFHSGPVADDLAALLQSLDPPDVQPDRRIEFQRTASGSRLWIAEHDSDFLPELIDEDDHAVGLADDRCRFLSAWDISLAWSPT